jgi:hypothetical protein
MSVSGLGGVKPLPVQPGVSDAKDPVHFEVSTPVALASAGIVGSIAVLAGSTLAVRAGHTAGIAGGIAGLLGIGVSGFALSTGIAMQADRQRDEATGAVLDAWDGKSQLPDWMRNADIVEHELGDHQFAFEATIGSPAHTEEQAAAAAREVAASKHDRGDLQDFAEVAEREYHDTGSLVDLVAAAARTDRSVADSTLILEHVRDEQGRGSGLDAARIIDSELPTADALSRG